MATMKRTKAPRPARVPIYALVRRRAARRGGRDFGENAGSRESRPARVTGGSGVARRTPQSWPLASRSTPFEGVWRALRLGCRAHRWSASGSGGGQFSKKHAYGYPRSMTGLCRRRIMLCRKTKRGDALRTAPAILLASRPCQGTTTFAENTKRSSHRKSAAQMKPPASPPMFVSQ